MNVSAFTGKSAAIWLVVVALSGLDVRMPGPEKWRLVQLHAVQLNRNVPEPGSLLLLGIGLVGAALSRRLR